MEFETKVIHAGIEPEATTGAVMTPIFQTSTYAQSAPGEHQGYEYSRTDNPTRTVLQNQLAALELGDHALVYSSGLAATDSVLNLLRAGDHVVAGDDLYGGTRRLFTRVAANRGLDFTFVSLEKPENLAAEMRSNMNVVDIAKISEVAHQAGALVAVDNTFMSPYFQNPLVHGADIVMHSITKYINGHSDVVMGCLVIKDQPYPGSDESLYARLKFLQNSVGSTPGPFDCFLVLRGIKTLALRMERHAENAAKVVQFLSAHSKVERVIYPGMPCHPGHAVSKKQTTGHGGMLTFFIKGGESEARKFLSSVKLFTLAESLGGVESLIEHPAIMTHASVPKEVRAQIGILDNLIRVSAGIEAANDLIADLDQALAQS